MQTFYREVLAMMTSLVAAGISAGAVLLLEAKTMTVKESLVSLSKVMFGDSTGDKESFM